MKKSAPRKRLWIWLTVGIALAAAIGAGVYYFTGEKPAAIQLDKVTRGQLSQIVTASGRANPAIKVEISANISAEIRKLYVKEGDRVAKDQPLVLLDSRRYEASNSQSLAAMRAAAAQVRLAAANADLAAKTRERQTELFKQNMTSKEALDTAETQHDVATATLEAARHAVSQAEAALNVTSDDLSKTLIRSPMDGVITRLPKQEGEMAIGNMFTRDVIMDVSNPNEIEATVDVDEADVASLKIGNAATVKIDALPGKKFDGKVIEIAGSAKINQLGTQEQTVSFEVKVLLSGDTAAIRPGMSATAEIVTATKEDVLQAPIQCVTMRDPEALAKLADKKHKKTGGDADLGISSDMNKMKEMVFAVRDGRVQPIWVKPGISSDTHIELTGDGLAEGQELACGPFKTVNRELKPGDRVEVKAEKGPGK
jgi:HlyD family secretion protein